MDYTLTITALRDRRRAGYGFRRGVARDVLRSELTNEQVAALYSDPHLKIVGRSANPASQVETVRPEDATAVDDAIRNALEALGPDGLTKSGKPSVAAVSKVLGYKVTAEEVAAANDQPRKDGSIDDGPVLADTSAAVGDAG